MTATATYNICYCSEGESGSSVSESFEEGDYNELLPLRPKHLTDETIMEKLSADEESTPGNLMGSTSPISSILLKDKIMKIRKKYSLDDTSALRIFSLPPSTASTPSINTDSDNPPPKIDLSISSSSLSSLTTDGHVNGVVNINESRKVSKSTKLSKMLGRNLSAAKSVSNDSDTMQEDAEMSSTTVQELEQAWDIYEEPLYATGSDMAEEERLDPSLLIGDWESSEISTDEDCQNFMKHGFDWGEESDTEDVNKLIEDSRMQLNIVREVIQQLKCDSSNLTYPHYIESCATCKTNIKCLENLLRALDTSMKEKELENEHVTSLKELLEQWRAVMHQLETEQPKNLGQKSKVKRRLKKKKMCRKFSCDVLRKDSIDPERSKTFAELALQNRSGSLPEVEIVRSLDTNLEQCRHTFAEVARQEIEGDARLMSALFFGLMFFLLLLKFIYSCCSDIELLSFDVTFFQNYLRENPPA